MRTQKFPSNKHFVLFFVALLFFAATVIIGAFTNNNVLVLIVGGNGIASILIIGVDGVISWWRDRNREKFETTLRIEPEKCNERTILMIIQDKVRELLTTHGNTEKARKTFYLFRNVITRCQKLSNNQKKWDWWIMTGTKTTFCFFLLAIISFGCSKQYSADLTKEIATTKKLAREYTSLPKITDGRTVYDQQKIREQKNEKKSELQNQYELVTAFGGGKDIRIKILQALYPSESQQNLECLSKINFISLINYARRVAKSSRRSWSGEDNTKKIIGSIYFVKSNVELDALFSLVQNGLIAPIFLDRFLQDIKTWKPYIETVSTPQQVKLIDECYLSEVTNDGEVGSLVEDKPIAKNAVSLLETTNWINSDVALELIKFLNLGTRFLNVPESEDVKAFQRAIIQISELATEMVNPERSLKEFKLKIKQKIRSGIPIQEIEKVFIKTWDEIE